MSWLAQPRDPTRAPRRSSYWGLQTSDATDETVAGSELPRLICQLPKTPSSESWQLPGGHVSLISTRTGVAACRANTDHPPKADRSAPVVANTFGTILNGPANVSSRHLPKCQITCCATTQITCIRGPHLISRLARSLPEIREPQRHRSVSSDFNESPAVVPHQNRKCLVWHFRELKLSVATVETIANGSNTPDAELWTSAEACVSKHKFISL